MLLQKNYQKPRKIWVIFHYNPWIIQDRGRENYEKAAFPTFIYSVVVMLRYRSE